MAFTEAGRYSPYELLDTKSKGADPGRPNLYGVPAEKPVPDDALVIYERLRRNYPDELCRGDYKEAEK